MLEMDEINLKITLNTKALKKKNRERDKQIKQH